MAQFITNAGIDVSKEWLDIGLWPDETVTLHLERGEAHCFDKLAAWLTEHQVRRVGLEASGGYEIEVMDALQARGFDVVRFNARRIRLFAKAIGRLAKNDRADATVIAQATAVLSVKQPKIRPRTLDPLVELLNYRRRLSGWIVDCSNQLEHLTDKALRRSTERRRASLDREMAEFDKKLAATLTASGPTNDLAQRSRRWSGPGGDAGRAAAGTRLAVAAPDCQPGGCRPVRR
jgi:transposase